MANIATIAKREAITQGWNLFITSATGQSPMITRYSEGVNIDWYPGQARKMEQYLLSSMETKLEPGDANVSVNLTPVLVPLGIKKGIGWVALYTTAIVILTKTLWK